MKLYKIDIEIFCNATLSLLNVIHGFCQMKSQTVVISFTDPHDIPEIEQKPISYYVHFLFLFCLVFLILFFDMFHTRKLNGNALAIRSVTLHQTKKQAHISIC